MDEDYYKILGLSRGASADEIQKSYRKLARKYHPDMNPDDKSAKSKFQQIQKAYDVLGDDEKRKKYDQFGSAFEQMEAGGDWQGQPFGGSGGEVDFSQIFGQRGFDPFGGGGGGFGDIFKQFTQQQQPAGGQRRGGGRRPPHRGGDIQHEVEIPFGTAILGGEVRLNIRRPSGAAETLEVKIPKGVSEGQTIRLRGQGEPGGGVPGDLLLTVRIAAHPHFARRGNDLIVKTPITVAEAALGGKVDVPSPWGTISLKIPPGSSSGKRLRIKGHGVRTAKGDEGDLYAELHVTLPTTLDSESERLIREFDQRNPTQPRAGLSW